MEDDTQVNIYNTDSNYEVYDELPDTSDTTVSSTEAVFPSDDFANQIVGGFTNEVFYDYLKLFFIIAFFIFCLKIFGIFFER